MQAIGAQAVNQAIKAIAIARSYLEEDNLDLSVQPSFVKLMLQDDERTAIKLRVVVEDVIDESDKEEDNDDSEEFTEESENTDED